MFHDHVAELEAGDLLLRTLVQARLDVRDHVVDGLDPDRSLLAGF